MAFYIRKISPAKWPQKGERISAEEIRADAVTGDLRTTEDTISLWRINSMEELNQAILALASGADRAVTYNVLAIPEEGLKKYGLILEASRGNTPAEVLADTHRDIVNVTYGSLGKLAQLIMETINADALYTVTKKKVKLLLAEAYRDGTINREKLKEGMRAELEKEIGKEAG